MKPEKLVRRWHSRLKDFEKSLGKEWMLCRQTGEVESIHRLRVLLRRLRVFLRLGNAILGKAKVEAFRSWSTTASNAIGRARDYDVTMAWLQQQPGSLRIYEIMGKRRAQLWNKARPKLGRCRELPLQALKDACSKHQQKKLANRFAKTFNNARQEILAFDTQLDPADTEHWHELRRDLRRIRYLRELCLSPKEQKKDRLLKALIHLQELLGEAQNCVAAATVLPKGDQADLVQLRTLLDGQRQNWLKQAEAALKKFQKCRALKNAV
jgi:CHAD domain-containing protein